MPSTVHATVGAANRRARRARSACPARVGRPARGRRPVAHGLRDLVNVCWRPVAIAGEPLRGRAGAWQRPDGAPQDGRRLTLDATGQAVVRVRTPGPDVRTVPRLLRLPIRTLPAAAAG
jgi:hypothetical protein